MYLLSPLRDDTPATSPPPAATRVPGPRRRKPSGPRAAVDPSQGGSPTLAQVIDLRLVRENPDAVRASQRARGADESLVDALLAADATRREAVKRFGDLRAEQKTASQAVRGASPDERPAI